MRILLVDDSRSASAVFASRLGVFGHEIFLAENGAVAVEKFRQLAPDLVLMDVEMPVMNGFVATHHIRNFETSQQWAWTPIIFLTADDTTENIVTAVDAGGDDLISKNVPEPVLLAKLKAMERVDTLRHNLLQANLRMEEDIRARQLAEAELSKRCTELTELNLTLSNIQTQLIQTEKMASIGQLAAGVAHEINNPIAFVLSNIGTLGKYLESLITALNQHDSAPSSGAAEQMAARQSLWEKHDIDYIRDDATVLIRETTEGVNRVKRIVQDLKDFSQLDSTQEWQLANLHNGIDATLNLLANELQDKAEIVKEYGSLPRIECLPKQLNQVFMSLLINATQAIGNTGGRVTIRTGSDDGTVWLEFIDNGCGIPESIRQKIFDPFFTTRPVGKGAGLGLSISYGIIRKHNGSIEARSKTGQGSCFRIRLPARQPIQTDSLSK